MNAPNQNPRVRVVPLDEVGSLDAPPGSRDWSIAVYRQIRSLFEDTESRVRSLQRWLKVMRDKEGYRQFTNELDAPFETFEEFVTACPPAGLGYPIEVVNRVLTEKADRALGEVLAQHGGDRKSAAFKQRQADQGSQRTLKRGETSEYLLARLKRDHPDVAARLERGEFKSVRAAAVEAGIIKKKSAADQILKLWQQASEEDKQLVLNTLGLDQSSRQKSRYMLEWNSQTNRHEKKELDDLTWALKDGAQACKDFYGITCLYIGPMSPLSKDGTGWRPTEETFLEWWRGRLEAFHESRVENLHAKFDPDNLELRLVYPYEESHKDHPGIRTEFRAYYHPGKTTDSEGGK